jgi:hypothetical protein
MLIATYKSKSFHGRFNFYWYFVAGDVRSRSYTGKTRKVRIGNLLVRIGELSIPLQLRESSPRLGGLRHDGGLANPEGGLRHVDTEGGFP